MIKPIESWKVWGVRCGAVVLAVAGGNHCAYGWGNEGHQIVGGVADIRVQSKAARQQIATLLEGQSLSEVATWADIVKKKQPQADGDANQDADTTAFIEQFHSVRDPATRKYTGGNGTWHYVNLPLGSTGYNDPVLRVPPVGKPSDFVGTPEQEDVVQKMQDCITVLQGNGDVHGAFGKKNALRMLVHLAGDIHQPLHVGCGYYDPAAPDASQFFVSDPAQILTRHLQGNSDQGGNLLFFPFQGNDEELHAFWDDVLVKDALSAETAANRLTVGATDTETEQHFSALLATEKPATSWDSVGAPLTWPVEWADDTLTQARTAYEGVAATSSTERHDFVTPYSNHASGFPVTLPDGYEAKMTPVAEEQMSKAGFRLARLLDAIWPDAQ